MDNLNLNIISYENTQKGNAEIYGAPEKKIILGETDELPLQYINY